MEVHHPHHPSHKKNWKEYLLEFFMLFFAVTLGFFAENIREKIAEQKKAKEMIETVAKDLKSDLAQLKMIREYEVNKIKLSDSLWVVLSSNPSTIDQRDYYRLLTQFSIFFMFNANDKSRNSASANGYFFQEENKQLSFYIDKYNFWLSDYKEVDKLFMVQAQKFIYDILPKITDPDLFDKQWRYPFPPIESKIGIMPISTQSIRKTKHMLSMTKGIMDTYMSDMDSMYYYANKAIETIEKQH